MQRNIALTGLGQLDDIATPLSDVNEEDIVRKYVQKSSYYTFVNPLQLGFTLAGNTDKATLEACETFGIAAGVAFQLHDDYLGMFGVGDETGKSNLDDLREGKYTLLMHHALEHASPEAVHQLRSLLGNPQASEADLKTVQELLRASGSEAYCQAEALRYADEAKHSLEHSDIGTPELRTVLRTVVEYSISREK
jgi:geranylgeranyl diphosphate synthase type I